MSDHIRGSEWAKIVHRVKEQSEPTESKTQAKTLSELLKSGVVWTSDPVPLEQVSTQAIPDTEQATDEPTEGPTIEGPTIEEPTIVEPAEELATEEIEDSTAQETIHTETQQVPVQPTPTESGTEEPIDTESKQPTEEQLPDDATPAEDPTPEDIRDPRVIQAAERVPLEALLSVSLPAELLEGMLNCGDAEDLEFAFGQHWTTTEETNPSTANPTTASSGTTDDVTEAIPVNFGYQTTAEAEVQNEASVNPPTASPDVAEDRTETIAVGQHIATGNMITATLNHRCNLSAFSRQTEGEVFVFGQQTATGDPSSAITEAATESSALEEVAIPDPSVASPEIEGIQENLGFILEQQTVAKDPSTTSVDTRAASTGSNEDDDAEQTVDDTEAPSTPQTAIQDLGTPNIDRLITFAETGVFNTTNVDLPAPSLDATDPPRMSSVARPDPFSRLAQDAAAAMAVLFPQQARTEDPSTASVEPPTASSQAEGLVTADTDPSRSSLEAEVPDIASIEFASISEYPLLVDLNSAHRVDAEDLGSASVDPTTDSFETAGGAPEEMDSVPAHQPPPAIKGDRAEALKRLLGIVSPSPAVASPPAPEKSHSNDTVAQRLSNPPASQAQDYLQQTSGEDTNPDNIDVRRAAQSIGFDLSSTVEANTADAGEEDITDRYAAAQAMGLDLTHIIDFAPTQQVHAHNPSTSRLNPAATPSHPTDAGITNPPTTSLSTTRAEPVSASNQTPSTAAAAVATPTSTDEVPSDTLVASWRRLQTILDMEDPTWLKLPFASFDFEREGIPYGAEDPYAIFQWEWQAFVERETFDEESKETTIGELSSVFLTTGLEPQSPSLPTNNLGETDTPLRLPTPQPTGEMDPIAQYLSGDRGALTPASNPRTTTTTTGSGSGSSVVADPGASYAPSADEQQYFALLEFLADPVASLNRRLKEKLPGLTKKARAKIAEACLERQREELELDALRSVTGVNAAPLDAVVTWEVDEQVEEDEDEDEDEDEEEEEEKEVEQEEGGEQEEVASPATAGTCDCPPEAVAALETADAWLHEAEEDVAVAGFGGALYEAEEFRAALFEAGDGEARAGGRIRGGAPHRRSRVTGREGARRQV